MAILIVGAGLVGSQIARILAEGGERPVLMDHAPQPEALGEIVELSRVDLIEGDVLRPLSIVEAIRERGITAVIHTAANPLLTLGGQRDPYGAIQLNIMGTVNVLEAARACGLKRVVVSSSNVLNHFLVGGEAGGDTTREEAFPRPSTFYAATKQAVESIGLNYARWNGMQFAAMRYGAVAGPWSGRGGGGPSNIVLSALRQALSGGEAVVPAASLEWVYAKDAAMATVLAVRAPDLKSGVFNATMGRIVSAQEFAAALQAAVPGARYRIETPARTAVALPNMERASDLRLAREVLGYKPAYDMAAAMAEIAAWLRGRAGNA